MPVYCEEGGAVSETDFAGRTSDKGKGVCMTLVPSDVTCTLHTDRMDRGVESLIVLIYCH